jgi:hypothetical protein
MVLITLYSNLGYEWLKQLPELIYLAMWFHSQLFLKGIEFISHPLSPYLASGLTFLTFFSPTEYDRSDILPVLKHGWRVLAYPITALDRSICENLLEEERPCDRLNLPHHPSQGSPGITSSSMSADTRWTNKLRGRDKKNSLQINVYCCVLVRFSGCLLCSTIVPIRQPIHFPIKCIHTQ